MTTYILTANAFREIYEYQLKTSFLFPYGKSHGVVPTKMCQKTSHAICLK